jgi:hypothetical protein
MTDFEAAVVMTTIVGNIEVNGVIIASFQDD